MSRLANAATVVFVLVLTLSTGSAQAQYRFENWTTDNGLPQNGVRGVGQMPDGYLWFTTFDGLVRFDGVRFTVFDKSNTKGIYSNRFAALQIETDGTLLASITQQATFQARELNRAFVQMQYFGYLRRNPNDAPDGNFNGYDFWVNKLKAADGNFITSEMVKAFFNSIEYRGRFGP